MALFGYNIEKASNSNTKSVSTFYGYSNYAKSYQSAIYKRIIGDCLTSLDYKDKWTSLYSTNIIDVLYSFITTGRLKGYLYFSAQNNCLAYFNDNKDKKIKELTKDLREVPVELYLLPDETQLLKNLSETFELIQLVMQNLGIKVKASSLIQVKLKDLREKASQDGKEGILKEVVDSIENNKNNILLLDAEDEIMLGNSDNQLNLLMENEKQLISVLSKLLGFPLSYFSGATSIGLGGENINDKEATIRGRENFYYRFLQSFFLIVSRECGIDIKPQTIAKDRFTPKELYDIVQLDELIDKEEIYKQLNLPMKKV